MQDYEVPKGIFARKYTVGGGVVVKKDPCQTEFQFYRVPRMGGIKLQLLYGVELNWL